MAGFHLSLLPFLPSTGIFLPLQARNGRETPERIDHFGVELAFGGKISKTKPAANVKSRGTRREERVPRRLEDGSR